MPHKRAFYPCCNDDITEPLTLLAGFVDEVMFVDLKAGPARIASRFQKGSSQPWATFLAGDVRQLVCGLPAIDVLFYRRDSDGEGGSGVYVLGDSFLPLVLAKFRPAGGYIVSDGSNSRGGNFRKMCRKSGLVKWGWKFKPQELQPFRDLHGLWIVSVQPEQA